jgi:hypothetical protein
LQLSDGPNRVIVRAARAAVNEGDSVEQESGGKRAEQEIFQGGFVRSHIITLKAGEHVGRDGKNLDSEERQDQVSAGRHQQHARAGEQQQSVVLAAADGLALVEAHRDERRDGRDHQKQPLEEKREII